MIKCPNCKKKTISYLAKWRSCRKHPVKCHNCGESSYTDPVLSSFWMLIQQSIVFVCLVWVFLNFTYISLFVFIGITLLTDYLRITFSPLQLNKE